MKGYILKLTMSSSDIQLDRGTGSGSSTTILSFLSSNSSSSTSACTLSITAESRALPTTPTTPAVHTSSTTAPESLTRAEPAECSPISIFTEWSSVKRTTLAAIHKWSRTGALTRERVACSDGAQAQFALRQHIYIYI